MLNVNVRISDANKLPMPVRLRITDASGKYYPPLGRMEFIPTGIAEDVGGSVKIDHEVYAYIDGMCEVPLPAGVPLRFQISKGPYWRHIDTTITLTAGQMSVRLELSKRFDDRQPSTDIDFRAHHIHPMAADLEGAAEGLDMVHVLAKVQPILGNDGETYPAMPQLLDYSGQTLASTRFGCPVFVNTLNTHPVLGQLALIYTHRPIFPLAFGGADGTDDWSLCDWADQAHRKKGLVVWCNPFEEDLKNGGEALVALILKKVDAIELSAQPRKVPFLPMLYRLWNAGLFVPLVGSSGKQSNKTSMGAMRTVVLGNDWIKNVRDGSTYITNSPELTWKVEDLQIEAYARSMTEFEKLELIGDGKALEKSHPTALGDRFIATMTATIPEHVRWVALRCTSRDGRVFAHSSTVYTSPGTPDPKAVAGLLDFLQQTQDWINTDAHFASEKRKQQHLDRIEQARSQLTSS